MFPSLYQHFQAAGDEQDPLALEKTRQRGRGTTNTCSRMLGKHRKLAKLQKVRGEPRGRGPSLEQFLLHVPKIFYLH